MKKKLSTENLHQLFIEQNQKICTDTRQIIPESIFFALSGENFNGNQFAKHALEKGCSYAIVDDDNLAQNDNIFLVENVLSSLQQLAAFHREKYKIPVLAITGSNGKTTTKELLNAVLSKKFNTLATKGNLNNHIGVPLTLLQLNEKHDFAIVEMGANHQKEIHSLCEIANPDFGIITNIGKAHLEGFGGIEGVKKGKGELFDFISAKGGKVFINGDDKTLSEMSTKLDKITYGTTKLFDVVGQTITSDPYLSFRWKTRYTASELKTAETVQSKLVGNYNLSNLLCAAAVGNFFKVSEADINQAITEYVPENNRSQLFKSLKNELILDMYNANPTSMEAAIENFAKMKSENKIVILGDMLELGEESAAEHEKIFSLAQQKRFEQMFLVGPSFHSLTSKENGIFFPNAEQALEYLKEKKLEGKTILIKGSRGTKLETLLTGL
jgi:UDP-N-acetylmuramoyl-tripeptide--D-alanyl-D-alanine ligase